MRILKTYKETYADGPGIRYSIYVSGCDLECPGCHNPESWAFNQGEVLSLMTLTRIKNEIKSNPMLTGITISGGDPLHPDNALGTQMLLEALKEFELHIMVFTGRTANQLIKRPAHPAQTACLGMIDVLVDGPFIESERDTSSFRGSKNQRFIKTKEMVQNDDLWEDKIEQYVIDKL